MRVILLSIVRKLIGSLVTPEHMREVIDVFFSALHAVVAKTPNTVDDAGLTRLEAAVNKDELAANLAAFLDTIL
jgi:hypothetical protein